MKKIKIILAGLSAVMCTACTGMLDLDPDGRVSINEIFSVYPRTLNYYNSCRAIPNYGFEYDGTMLSSFCDEAQDVKERQGGLVSAWYEGRATSVSNPLTANLNAWTHYFSAIRKCNTFLQAIQDPEIATYPFNEEQKQGWIGNVMVYRAFYYLQLIKRYGGVPLIDTPYEADHDFSKDRRGTFEECVDFIIKSCDDALALPEPTSPTYGFRWDRVQESQSFEMTRAVAWAIKSQAALYAASDLWYQEGSKYTWTKVAEITKEALDQCLNHGFELYDNEAINIMQFNDYAYYFFNQSDWQRGWDKETILSASNRLNMWQLASWPGMNGQASAGTCPSQELIDSYEVLATDGSGKSFPLLNPEQPYWDANHTQPNYNQEALPYFDEKWPYNNRDLRLTATVYYNSADLIPTVNKMEMWSPDGAHRWTDNPLDVLHTHTGYYLRKYSRWEANRDNPCDGFMRIFRLGELYLNFAEAANEAYGPEQKVSSSIGNPMSAREAVNKIRLRVNLSELPADMLKDQFRIRYRNERRVELAFEEHRFFDVRRWKILDQTDKFVTGVKIYNNAGIFQYDRFKLSDRAAYTDKYLMFPIPQTEVSKMMKLTGVNWQNPGWE